MLLSQSLATRWWNFINSRSCSKLALWRWPRKLLASQLLYFVTHYHNLYGRACNSKAHGRCDKPWTCHLTVDVNKNSRLSRRKKRKLRTLPAWILLQLWLLGVAIRRLVYQGRWWNILSVRPIACQRIKSWWACQTPMQHFWWHSYLLARPARNVPGRALYCGW